jgi:acyl-CoA reductase-like NAD-dependent aldehyde dehydrogenase
VLRSINPATGEGVGEIEATPVGDVPGFVERARRAQPAWAALGPEGRAAVLREAAGPIREAAADVGRLLTREMGKPLREATGEVASTAAGLAQELAEMAEALAPEVIDDGQTRSTLYHDPFGVAAVITPWNFPFLMPHWMVLPALMAGNAVLLKPSELTPLTGQAYADLLNRVLPPGVLQVVQGDEAQGKALVQADVDLIAFTGSREAGKQILAAASRDLKRVVLELGGKDPLVVLGDADLDRAAKFAARNAFRNAGQVCVSTERIYVEAPVADRFLEKLVAAADALRVGDGLAPDTDVGPMVSAGQRDKVVAQVREALARGARLLRGSAEPRGNFLEPMVLTDVPPDLPVAREETFGPVVCVFRVADEDEAVRQANDSPFGLGAVVFGGEQRAAGVARRLAAGMIGINRGPGGAVGTPWVGARQSGYGFHKSRDGHRQFAQTRVISADRPRAGGGGG